MWLQGSSLRENGINTDESSLCKQDTFIKINLLIIIIIIIIVIIIVNIISFYRTVGITLPSITIETKGNILISLWRKKLNTHKQKQKFKWRDSATL